MKFRLVYIALFWTALAGGIHILESFGVHINWVDSDNKFFNIELSVLALLFASIVDVNLALRENGHLLKEQIDGLNKQISKLQGNVGIIEDKVNTATSIMNNSNLKLFVLSEILSSKITGVIKPVEESTIWEMENEIIGWNPNWALELGNISDNKITKGLIKIHQRRMTEKKVRIIKYYFLDQYKLRTSNGRLDTEDHLKFSAHFFLNFLTKHLGKPYENEIAEKYEVWLIPEDKWKKPAQEDASDIHRMIKPIRDFIFIAGNKHDTNVGLLFLNNHLFCNSTGHSHYIELHTESPVLNGFIANIITIEESLISQGIPPQKILWNQNTNRYCFSEMDKIGKNELEGANKE